MLSASITGVLRPPFLDEVPVNLDAHSWTPGSVGYERLERGDELFGVDLPERYLFDGTGELSKPHRYEAEAAA